jgi:hypothetical protein
MNTLAKLQKRQRQLNSLIVKFAGVKSLIRKWAFELTVIEGEIEKSKPAVSIKYDSFKYLTDIVVWMTGDNKYGFSPKGYGAPTRFPYSSSEASKTAARVLINKLKAEAISNKSLTINAERINSSY